MPDQVAEEIVKMRKRLGGEGGAAVADLLTTVDHHNAAHDLIDEGSRFQPMADNVAKEVLEIGNPELELRAGLVLTLFQAGLGVTKEIINVTDGLLPKSLQGHQLPTE